VNHDDKFDINDVLREDGVEGVRRRISGAKRYTKATAPDGIGQDQNGLRENSGPDDHQTFVFNPEPYRFPDPASIPRRQWLYGRHYVRGAVSMTVGAPGRAKSTLDMTEIIGMSAGRDLLTGQALECGPLRAAYLNGEENQDELDRRAAAICQRYGITHEDCGDRLWVVSTRDTPIRLAVPGPKGAAIVAQEIVEGLAKWCNTHGIDVLVVDPLISFHGVRENDSGDMDLVCKEAFGKIAGKDRAVELVHHPRKLVAGEVNTTVDDARGSSAALGAVRIGRTVNFMTTTEATQLGTSEDDRRRHLRIENGKSNPGPVGKAHWIKIEVENLPNGDEVAVVIQWKPPDPFQNVTIADMELARELARTGDYRDDVRSPKWFGWRLAGHLKVPIQYGGANSKLDMARIKAIIKKWLQTNVLEIDRRKNEDGKDRNFIIPGSFQPEPHHIPTLTSHDNDLALE